MAEAFDWFWRTVQHVLDRWPTSGEEVVPQMNFDVMTDVTVGFCCGPRG